MSCMMLPATVHAAMADTLAVCLNQGYNRVGFDAPASLFDALSDCEDYSGRFSEKLIFERLYSLNLRAYNSRYPSDATDDETPDKPQAPALIQPRQAENYHEKILPWHYAFVKLLDSIIYQTNEKGTREDPLRLALVEFARDCKFFIVSNSAEYAAAPWASV